MKIRVEFSTGEKVEIRNTLEVTGKDETKEITGNFGKIKYDSVENYIDIDLKPVFFQASLNLIGICINTIKALVNSFRMFELTWFSEYKITTGDGNMSEEDSDANEKEKENE